MKTMRLRSAMPAVVRETVHRSFRHCESKWAKEGAEVSLPVTIHSFSTLVMLCPNVKGTRPWGPSNHEQAGQGTQRAA